MRSLTKQMDKLKTSTPKHHGQRLIVLAGLCAIIGAGLFSGCVGKRVVHAEFTRSDSISSVVYDTAFKSMPKQTYLVGIRDVYVLGFCPEPPTTEPETANQTQLEPAQLSVASNVNRELCQQRLDWLLSDSAHQTGSYPALTMTMWLVHDQGEPISERSQGTYTLYVPKALIAEQAERLLPEEVRPYELHWVNVTYHTHYELDELVKLTLESERVTPSELLFEQDIEALRAQGLMPQSFLFDMKVYSESREESLFYWAY